MFNIHQGPSKYLKEYLARVNEAAIKVIYPNLDMFVGVFHNGLRAEYFNESLTYIHVTFMVEVVMHIECYIKVEERKTEKMARGAKDLTYDFE